MSIARIYQNVPLALQQTLRLDDKASHHLARVLRAKVGDELIIFNGQGGEYVAAIAAIDKKAIEVVLHEYVTREAESPIYIQLAQGIARGEKMDFIVQKAVELGVNYIFPLVTARCNVRLSEEREEKKAQHWEAVMVSACEQSGRNRIPTLTSPMAYEDFLQNARADKKFVLSPHAQSKLPEDKVSPGQSVLLLIGPEGGLSETEIAAAVAAGFVPLNLGPRVLRTETATIAALAMLQCWFGDMR